MPPPVKLRVPCGRGPAAVGVNRTLTAQLELIATIPLQLEPAATEYSAVFPEIVGGLTITGPVLLVLTAYDETVPLPTVVSCAAVTVVTPISIGTTEKLNGILSRPLALLKLTVPVCVPRTLPDARTTVEQLVPAFSRFTHALFWKEKLSVASPSSEKTPAFRGLRVTLLVAATPCCRLSRRTHEGLLAGACRVPRVAR